jgi:hypothetical protein
MVEKREPSIKDQSITKPSTERLDDFVNDLLMRIRQFDIDGTETFREKLRTARNQRQGIKRVTNIPYPGAPDIPLPEADKLIRKQKPLYVLSATSGRDFVTIKPMEGVQDVDDEMKEKARKSELAMNHLFKKKIPWIQRLTLAADRFLEKGLTIFKVIEKFESRQVSHTFDRTEFTDEELRTFKDATSDEKEQALIERFGFDPEIDEDNETIADIIKRFNNGDEIIEFNTEEVDNLPDVIIPTAEKVYVSKGTTDLQSALRITHEFFIPEHKLIEKALNQTYMKNKVFEILEDRNNLKTGDGSLNEKIKDRLAGVNDNEEDGELFKIWECYAWFQPKEKGPYERWVFTFLPDVGGEKEGLIQKIRYPFEMKEWNFIRHDNEITDENHHRSRGIPEQIRAIQEFMERSVNNMIIRDNINNAPMYTVLTNSPILSSNIKFIPGQKIKVNSHDEIRELGGSKAVDVSSERIQQILKAFAEEYIGSSDQLFRNATNAGGGKTLGEVKQGIASNQPLANLDVLNWLSTLSKVYTTVFNIMKERMIRPLIINGETITREDFQFIPDIHANGSVENADKQFRAQQTLTLLQMARQAKGDGVATLEDVFTAYERFFEANGASNSEDFVTDPEIILKEMITQLEQQAQKLNQTIAQQNKAIDDGEKALDKIQGKIGEETRDGQAVRTS